MSSIEEIGQAVGQIRISSGDMRTKTSSSSVSLGSQGQLLSQLGRGSRTGELAARMVIESSGSLRQVASALQLLETACENYQKAIRQ